MNFSKIPLSGSTDFVGIVVTQTAIASGDTIHTAGGALPAFDELYVYVTNTDSADRQLTLVYGGTTDPTHMVSKAVIIPALSGPTPIITGQATTNGKILKAACDVANKVVLTGFVNRAS